MIITIPGQPISVNALYRGRRFLTKEGESVKFAYKSEAWRQWKKKPVEDKDLAVTVRFFFSDHRKHDIDNCLKGLLDSLSGVLWEDDDQIVELHVKKLYRPKNPGIELSFEAL